MTPNVASSDSILQFMAYDIMQIDHGELDDQLRAYHESIVDFKLDNICTLHGVKRNPEAPVVHKHFELKGISKVGAFCSFTLA